MPTKSQAKAAIDSATTVIKNDIDTILPVGVNIKDGSVKFNPTRFSIMLDGEGVSATGESLLTSISANLTTAGRTFTVQRQGRRRGDGVKNIVIVTQLATYFIVNIG